MKCHHVERSISEYIDGVLSGKESEAVAAHLGGCGACANRARQLQILRSGLRRLSEPQAPPELSVALRVLASRTKADRRSAFAQWLDGVRLWADNLMRPLALPFAGGLVSTIVLFGLLLPSFWGLGVSTANDVPTVLATDPMLVSATSYGSWYDEIVVDLTVDELGRVVDYTIPPGQALMTDPDLRRSVENTLLMARFTPATVFGVPAPGKTRITLRRSHIDVRG